MSDVNCVVEGRLKYRDGKRWKQRWCTIKKPSPAADCLHVQLYKDVKDVMKNGTPKSSIFVENFLGLEAGFNYDKENHVLTIICQKQVIFLAFENRESLISFEIKIRRSLGEEDQFPVQISKVPSNSKLQLENVHMLIHGQKFGFVTSVLPPKVLAVWHISDLRKFGMFAGKFVFEGGKSCGRGAGVHVLTTDQADEIEEILQQASEGKTASCSKSNKRRSQLFDPDYMQPLKNCNDERFLKEYRNRQNITDLNFLDDNRWRKRHSFSHKDYSHSTESDSHPRLTSIENIVRQKKISHYDVPPPRIKKVESFKRKTNAHQNYQNTLAWNPRQTKDLDSSFNQESHKYTSHFIKESSDIDGFKRSESCSCSVEDNYCSSHMDITDSYSSACLHNMATVSASEPMLTRTELGLEQGKLYPENDKILSNSVPNKIDDQKCQEEMDSLKKSELLLQKEITLLDEILQGVKFKKVSDSSKGIDEPPVLPAKKCQSSSGSQSFYMNAADEQYARSQGSISAGSDQDENMLLSPNLVTKLRKIPPNSKMSAPLPYVNLEKYDLGDVDNGHVYLSRDSLCHHSRSCEAISAKIEKSNRREVAKKYSSCNMRRRCGSESGIQASDVVERAMYAQEENIYTNDFPFKENSPPPVLPPKGPSLLRKCRKYPRHDLPPPIPPSKHRLSLYSSNNSQICKATPRCLMYPKVGHLTTMSSRVSSAHTDCVDNDVILKVKLPKQSSSLREQSSRDEPFGYMDMSGMFEDEQTVSKSLESTPAKYHQRSESTSSISDTEKVQSPTANEPIREENYLLMSHFNSPQSSLKPSSVQNQNLSSGKEENVNIITKKHTEECEIEKQITFSQDASKISLPFPNLMGFKHNILPEKVSTKPSTEKSSPYCGRKSEGDSTAKGTGLLSRLIRRNSGNRKSMSQSQENLLASSSSESSFDKNSMFVIKDGSDQEEVANLLESAVQSSSCQSKVNSSTTIQSRQRSSSFPNRSSFIDGLGKVEENWKSQDNDIKTKDTKHSSTVPKHDQGINENKLGSTLNTDNPDYGNGKCQEKTFSKDKDDEDDDDYRQSSKLSTKTNMGIFTVLHVDQSENDMNLNSSKTDDEKLIELLNYSKSKDYYSDTDSSKSLKSESSNTDSMGKEKVLSPCEEAAAIAKHVSSLPPFVPLKQKVNPCSLSPVLESAPSFPCENKSTVYGDQNIRPFKSNHSLGSISKTDFEAALQSITSQEQSVWIPRSQSDSSLCKSTRTIQSKDQEAKFTALVVEVSEYSDIDDTVSISSQESYHAKDEIVQNSPATTILRPRAGKNYLIVERKRPLIESFNSSPAQSPNSPSVNSSVFTFDQVSCSQYSNYSRERESPNIAKFSRSDSLYSRFSERNCPARNMYMNVDMTPPSSPLPNGLCPSESGDRQLNYADIDLTLSTKSSRKLRKSSQKSLKIPKSETIDYAMIDMEATVAIQHAGQEHKMSREDSLRRSSQKLTLLPQQVEEEEEEEEASPTFTSASPNDKDEGNLMLSTVQEGDQSTIPDDFKIPISATHKYVNVPPPKDQDQNVSLFVSEPIKENDHEASDFCNELLETAESLLLPIRKNQGISSSSDEESDSSSDDEVLIIE